MSDEEKKIAIIECAKSILTHEQNMIEGNIVVKSLSDWQDFKEKILALRKEYSDLPEELYCETYDKGTYFEGDWHSEYNKSYFLVCNYLETFVFIISKVQKKFILEELTEEDFRKIMQSARIICFYNNLDFKIEKMRRYISRYTPNFDIFKDRQYSFFYKRYIVKIKDAKGNTIFMPEDDILEFHKLEEEKASLKEEYEKSIAYINDETNKLSSTYIYPNDVNKVHEEIIDVPIRSLALKEQIRFLFRKK